MIFVILLVSKHVKPLPVSGDFPTSRVLMQDRAYLPLLKMENARYLLSHMPWEPILIQTDTPSRDCKYES